MSRLTITIIVFIAAFIICYMTIYLFEPKFTHGKNIVNILISSSLASMFSLSYILISNDTFENSEPVSKVPVIPNIDYTPIPIEIAELYK